MLYCDVCCVYFFFFKQKTAYEMRISDWSSDVCSSDLPPPQIEPPPTRIKGLAQKPSGLTLDALDLLPKLGWDAGFYPRWRPGEDGALHALDRFMRGALGHYATGRSEEHTSELHSLMRISYAVFCLKKKKQPRLTRHTRK